MQAGQPLKFGFEGKNSIPFTHPFRQIKNTFTKFKLELLHAYTCGNAMTRPAGASSQVTKRGGPASRGLPAPAAKAACVC